MNTRTKKNLTRLSLACSLLSPVLLLPTVLLGTAQTASADTPRLFLDPGGHTSVVRQVLYTPDGKHIISVGNDKSIRVWDAVTGTQVGAPIYGQVGDAFSQGQLLAAALDPDGKRLAVAGRTFTGILDTTDPNKNHFAIRVFRLDNLAARSGGATLQMLLPHADDSGTSSHTTTIDALAFSPDGRYLASGSADNTLRLWDLDNGKCKVLDEKEGLDDAVTSNKYTITCLAWSPDGRQIASGGRDKRVRIWNTDGEPLKMQELKEPAQSVRCLAWSPRNADNGKTILIGTMSDDENTGTLQAWDLGSDKIKTVSMQDKPVSCVAYSPDGRYAALGQDVGAGGTCQVRVWPAAQVGNAAAARSLSHDSAVQSVAFAPRGETLASGTNSGDIFLWSLANGTAAPRRLGGTGGPTTDVRWAADGKALTWKSGGETHVYQLDLADCLSGPAPGSWPGGSLLKDNANHTLSLADDGRAVQISDNSNFTVPAPTMSSYKNDFVRSETFTPDGKDILVGSNLFLRRFSASTGQQLRVFTGHTAAVLSLAVSPDGKYLASSSDDQTVRIWSLASGDTDVKPILSIFADNARNYVAWTPEGYYACSPIGQSLVGWQRNQGDDAKAAYDYAASFPVLRRPDVIAALWKYDGSLLQAIGAVGAPDTNVSKLKPPTVEILGIKDGQKVDSDTLLVTAGLTQGSSRLAKVKVAVNGHGLPDDNLTDVPAGQTITRKWTVRLVKGKENLISVTAYDQPEDANSQPTNSGTSVTVICTVPAPPTHSKPRLTVLAIGVRRYRQFLDLLYPDKDADAIVKDFQDQEGKLFEKVTSYELTNKNATKQKILDTLKQMQATSPDDNDYTIVFVAGHGGQTDAKHYYFLPYDVDTSVDAQTIDKTAVNWDDFYAALKNLPGHVLLLLDTCHSAGAVTEAKPDAPLDVQTNNLAYREFMAQLETEGTNKTSSVITLASCEPGETSQELSKFKHGAFAEALIEGLQAVNNPAHPDANGQITLTRLHDYVAQTVGLITNHNQHPMSPLGNITLETDSLPLAIVSPEVAARTASR